MRLGKSGVEQALRAAPSAVRDAFAACLSVPCRPSKRNGRRRARQGRLPFSDVTLMAVMQAEQETSCGDRLAGSNDLTRLVYRPTALNGRYGTGAYHSTHTQQRNVALFCP